MQPALLTSDVHLSPEHGLSASRALARLFAEFRGVEVHLVGDIFDLSQTPEDERPTHTLERILATHAEWVRACQTHLAEGGQLCFVPGNHDADLSAPDTAAVLRAALKPPDDRQLSIAPWFCRRGSVHIEHGHVYDPDCAPNHPLAPANPSSEGLGTAMVRRFLAPYGALEFAHAHEITPRSGLRLALDKWGAATPLNVFRYFQTTIGLCLETLTQVELRRGDVALGSGELLAHSERTGLDVTTLGALLAAVPRPTHDDFKATFVRLYYDRIVAGVGAGVGLALLGAAPLVPAFWAAGPLAALAGAGYLRVSRASSARHGRGPDAALVAAASSIRALTDCSLVVFGHSHVAHEAPGYVNLGSFGFAEGARPYVLLDQAGRAEAKLLSA